LQKIIDKKVALLKEEIITTTSDILKIKSLKSTAKKNMPFGEGVDQALTEFLALGENHHLKAKNIDHYAGHLEIGQGDEILGILCHLDVVPEGNDWTYPPYGGEVHAGKIYGRGAIDDKGPAVAAMYAMKIVNELDIELNKRVRLILGTNEESGMEGLKYYLKHEKGPDIAFSPDATFPAIYAEKGIMNVKLTADFSTKDELKGPVISEIKGGNASNMVPDYAEAVFSGIKLSELKNSLADVDYDEAAVELKDENKPTIIYHGVSAHGSTPQSGINAISHLMKIIGQLPLADPVQKSFVDIYNEKIGLTTDGSKIGCADQDEPSGNLTFNVGIIQALKNNNKAEVIINIRYPVTSTSEKVIADIQKGIKGSDLKAVITTQVDPLYIEKDDHLIKSLMKVYRDYTGDQSEPIAIGGGTYARSVEKGVAFGALFPGQPELAHQKDEYIGIEELLKNVAIYALAIIELAGK